MEFAVKPDNRREQNEYGPSKRQRGDGETVDPHNPCPSLVCHCRGLPDGVNDYEIREATRSCGEVAYVMLMPKKKQALIEFVDLDGSRQCVESAARSHVYLRGVPLFINYSTSQSIIRPPAEEDLRNHVLLYTIINATYPITCEVINQITISIAKILRMVLFRKNGVQAMVEFANVDDATRVKNHLNGADIYSGCCTLKVEYAKPQKLNVNYNDPNVSWDFTRGDPSTPAPPQNALLPDPVGFGPQSSHGGGGASGYQHQTQQQQPAAPQSYQQQQHQQQHQSNGGYWGSDPPQDRSYPDPYQTTHREVSGHSQHAQPKYGVLPVAHQNCVCMVYGLRKDINGDKIFNMLCQYGNVVKVKFLKTKEGSAMVQMADTTACNRVMDMLNGAELFDQKLNIAMSRQPYLDDSRALGMGGILPDGTQAFRDFYATPGYEKLQRYNTPDQAAKNRAMTPTATVHFFNAPPHVTEEQMTNLIVDAGSPQPSRVKILPSKTERSSSGLFQFECPREAAECIILANHSEMPNPTNSERPPFTVKLCFCTLNIREDGGGNRWGRSTSASNAM